METKRLILAVVICAVLILGWNSLSHYMGWVKEPVPPAPKAETQAQAPAATVEPDLSTPADDMGAPQQPAYDPGKTVTVNTPLYTAVFQVDGGILYQFYTKAYKENTLPDSPMVNMISPAAARFAPMGLLLNGAPTWKDAEWTVDRGDIALDATGTGTLRFSALVNNVRLTRELTFTADNYTIAEKTYLEADNAQTVKVGYTFGTTILPSEVNPSILQFLRYYILGGDKPKEEPSSYNQTRVALLEDGSLEKISSGKDLDAGKAFTEKKIGWMGIMNNYFLGAVSTKAENTIGRVKRQDNVYRVVLEQTGLELAPGKKAEAEATYFVGPKEPEKLNAAPNDLNKSLDFGLFSFIAKPLLLVLQFFHKFVGNYGIAIILLTLVIKIIFIPLSHQSFKSMQQMKKIQPLVNNLREKYKDDKEALNRETMALYKTYKISPMGGCLPMLVQMPVFFGLYQALMNSIELRHAAFIKFVPFTDIPWLADLSAKDPFFVTPIIMGLTMLWQQKMTPASADPNQAKMMMLMPLVFTFVFFNLPSGLVVYWLVNNVLSIAQQWYQLRGTKEIGKA